MTNRHDSLRAAFRAAGLVTEPCVDCGQPVTTYPPEDGHGPWRCGRCAGRATPQRAEARHG